MEEIPELVVMIVSHGELMAGDLNPLNDLTAKQYNELREFLIEATNAQTRVEIR
jgi:hypothetical protein